MFPLVKPVSKNPKAKDQYQLSSFLHAPIHAMTSIKKLAAIRETCVRSEPRLARSNQLEKNSIEPVN